MASINLNGLAVKNKNIDQYKYTDLHLDMDLEYLTSSSTLQANDSRGRDIKMSIDLNAIKNSIRNLFNTVPTERILLPDYGCDLRRFIFEPISKDRGVSLRETIISSIQKWEPRVRVVQVYVYGKPSTNEYEINLELEVPFLAGALNISSILTRSGYTIIG